MVSDARFASAQLVLEVDDPPACHTLADLPRDAAASHALLQVRGGITPELGPEFGPGYSLSQLFSHRNA